MSRFQDRIADMLAHYFRLAFTEAGLGWHSDNDMEMQQIAQLIANLVDDRIRQHAEDAPHIYADGSTH